MKKLLSCLLCAAILLASCAFAAAEIPGFDRSLFETGDYEITETTDTAYGYIDPSSLQPCYFDPNFSADYYCTFCPDILLLDDAVAFRLWVNFFAQEDYGFHTAVFNVNGNTYTITDVNGKAEVIENGDTHNRMIIYVGEGLHALMNDLSAGGTLLLQGSNNSYELEITDSMIDCITGMYADFISAGGTNFYYAYDESAFTVINGSSSISTGDMPSVSNLIGRFSETETPVATDAFNLSLFENDPTYEISDSSSSTNRYIDIVDWEPCFFDPLLSENYYCVFAPDVLLRDDGSALYRLWCQFYSQENNNIDTAEISFAGYTFNIGDIGAGAERMDNGDICEQTVIVVGEELIPMMEAMRVNSGAEIKVCLSSSTFSYEFVMEDSMKNTILSMYDKFVQAGGLNPEYLASAYDHPVSSTVPANEVVTETPAVNPGVNVAGFDMSLFGAEFDISEPTETSHGYIDLADRDPVLFDPNYSQDYYCVFAPDVQLRVDGNVQFRLWSYFYAKREFDIDTAVFTFPDATYTIHDIDAGSKELDNGDIREYLVINIGTQLSNVIEKLRANMNSTVSLELTGANGNYRFNMPTSMKESIVNMYDLFIQAGGASFMNADTENRFSVE